MFVWKTVKEEDRQALSNVESDFICRDEHASWLSAIQLPFNLAANDVLYINWESVWEMHKQVDLIVK